MGQWLRRVPRLTASLSVLSLWLSVFVTVIRRALKTITTDNGIEFYDHEEFAKALKTKVYFADSYASWQKGAIENANKLIRQYFPKGSDFRKVADYEVKQIQYKLNRRPRAKLGFSTPTKEFYKMIS